MSELSQLYPQLLWNMFSKICSIPHPSCHEEKLAEYIVKWARGKRLHVERDQIGNILICKVATSSMKKRKPVVLQAHLDMVPQKNNDVAHDFTKDPIQPYIDGEWVKTRGTTLGADNGIGMASALAILSDSHIEHGPLEVLLTINEEVGMEGASGIQPHWLNANILINTDSEEEEKIYIGCASGVDFISTLSLSRKAILPGFHTFKLALKGLKGGHSGSDIHLGLGNANKLLIHFLARYSAELDLCLIDFNGGTLRNAIPREASAIIAVATDKVCSLKKLANDYLIILKKELFEKESKLTLTLEEIENNKAALTIQSRDSFIQLLNATPNGVIHSADIDKCIVETSLNIGVVTMSNDSVEVICMIRSINDSSRDNVVSTLESLGKLVGAKTSFKERYPSWNPDTSSPVLALVLETYQRLFKKVPDIQVVHAGLECGLFKKSYPDMDMVSIGPTIIGAHSPGEQVYIKSVGHYWKLLTELIKVIPEK